MSMQLEHTHTNRAQEFSLHRRETQWARKTANCSQTSETDS